MDSLYTEPDDDLEMADSTLRAEMRRIEDRLELRLNRIADESQAWRTRVEAQSDNRHLDNLKRLEALEKQINQGIGAISAARYIWYVLIGLAGIIAGFFGHKIGN